MKNLWEKCLKSLAQKIQEKPFNQWIKPLDGIVSDDASIITIFVINRFALEFINKEYKSLIEETITSLCSSIKVIKFSIPKDSKARAKPEATPPKKDEKAEEKPPKTENKPSTELLAICAESERILPNEIVRSALFNARNRKQARQYMRGVEIAVIGGGKITYRGEELRQDDAAVFMHIVHIAKTQPMGSLVEFTPYSICKAIGWGIGGEKYKRLQECLSRMQATALEVRSPRINGVWGGESMSMIPYFRWKEGDKTLAKYEVRLAPQLVELFGSVHYTRTDWEQRLALPDGLATWLHTYFASHRKPHPIAIETIMEGAGMTIKDRQDAAKKIRTALAKLTEVGFLTSWEIVGGFVHVTRT